MKKDEKNHRIKLDAKSSLFFAHLVNEGLAEHVQDPSMGEDEVHASFQKDGNKKGKLLLHTNAFIIYIASNDKDKGK